MAEEITKTSKPKKAPAVEKPVIEGGEEEQPAAITVPKIAEKFGPKIQSLKTEDLKVLSIGVGQGGSRLAHDIGLQFNTAKHCFFINTSEADIDGMKEIVAVDRSIKLGGAAVEGSGKDRKVAEGILAGTFGTIILKLVSYVLEERFDIIFINFSTSGGTGSGMGPKLTALFDSLDFWNEVRKADTGKNPVYGDFKPLVFGIAITPEISGFEGNLSLENTLECLEDIDAMVNINESGSTRYFLVSNGFFNIKSTDIGKRTTQHQFINKAVASKLYRYLTQFAVGPAANYDRADRFSALQVLGLHSLGTLKPAQGNVNRAVKGPSPFLLPEGERVRRICYEVPEAFESDMLNHFTSNGLLADDIIHGYYNPGEESNVGLDPIIGYHGFRNVGRIAENFRNRLQQNIEKAKAAEAENRQNATGLDDIAKARAFREAEYGGQNALSFGDIFGKK
jgi:hypothetical protein